MSGQQKERTAIRVRSFNMDRDIRIDSIWVKYALKTEGIHAESKIAIIFAVLRSISEEKFREWVRMITK